MRKRTPVFPLPGSGSTWMSEAPWLYASTMILFTSFTSSLSAAAETSSVPLPRPPSSSSSRLESRSPMDSLPAAPSAPKYWSRVSAKSRSVVTRKTILARGKTFSTMRELRTRSGSVDITITPCLESSSGIQWLPSA